MWTIRVALACMCQHIDAWSKVLSPSIQEEKLFTLYPGGKTGRNRLTFCNLGKVVFCNHK